jgi:hypothetical protein
MDTEMVSIGVMVKHQAKGGDIVCARGPLGATTVNPPAREAAEVGQVGSTELLGGPSHEITHPV